MVAERIATVRFPLRVNAVDALAASLRGELIRPEDDEYESARQVWNGMIDRRPALIVRCVDATDIVHAIAFARTNSLPIAIRGGGHNVAGFATTDGGLVIDLSLMKGVTVDPVARVARAEPGLLLGELDRATQAHGLAVTAGQVSHTGIAGLTLGGGMGWLMRKHGLTVDNVLAVELVSADGELLRASADEHPDLFWAVRGGGGNFGVVTAFEYRLHPVGPMILGGMVVHPIAQARTVLQAARAIMADAPDELALSHTFMTEPPQVPFPVALHGRTAIATVVCYAGDLTEGERVVAPLRAIGDPALDLVGPMPYLALQSMIDASVPHGRSYYEKSGFMGELTDDAIETVIEAVVAPTSPFSGIMLARMGGAVGRVPRMATAFAHRDAAYSYVLVSAWDGNDSDGDRHVTWVRAADDLLQPHSTGGAYVNCMADEGGARIPAAYPIETYEWLRRVKVTYDPLNVFRINQNIRPAE